MTFSVHGLAVARGIAIGRAVLVASSRVDVAHYFVEPSQVEGEIERVRQGRNAVVEELQRLQTDYLDIVHLHSCSLAVLQQGDAIRALQDAQQAGKIRVIAYSGENDELAWAVNSGLFGSVEHSLSLCDQRVIQQSLPQASAAGLPSA